MYVPNVPKVKLLILDEIHKTPYSGHPGYQKTITMLRKEYFWPNMKTEVAEYIARNTYFIKFGNILLQGLHPHWFFWKSLNTYSIKSRKINSKNYSIKFGIINPMNYFLN